MKKKSGIYSDVAFAPSTMKLLGKHKAKALKKKTDHKHFWVGKGEDTKCSVCGAK